jgi:hypothetical protein
MQARPKFKLTRQATIGLLVSAAFSAAAGAAPVAMVEFTSGPVRALGPDGKPRAVAKGSVLERGDTIETGSDGRAQLRFADGAYMSLQPQTVFRVDEFQWEGRPDGTERGFFSLLRGALRTVTGAIGRTNNSTYRVRTTTATIGIRGTGYLLRATNSIELSVGEGTGLVVPGADPQGNPSGPPFLVPPGTTAFLSTPSTPPVFTQTPPILPPAPADVPAKQGGQPTPPPGESESQQTTTPTPPPPPPQFSAGEQTTSSGTSAIVPTSGNLFPGLASGPGYAMAYSIGGEGGFCELGCVNAAGGGCGARDVSLGPVSFMQGNIGDFFDDTSVVWTITNGTAQLTTNTAGGVIAHAAVSGGTINVQGSSMGFFDLSGVQGAHFIAGMPSPVPNLASSITYSLFPGNYPVTFSTNNSFGLGSGSVTGMSFTVNAPGTSYSATMNVGFTSGNVYQATLNGGVNALGGFAGGGNFNLVTGTSSICAGTSSSCTATDKGFLSGPLVGTPAGPQYGGIAVKANLDGTASGTSMNFGALFQR